MESTKPYYFGPEDLRLQADVLTPTQRRKFDEIEREVSTAFLNTYGKYLDGYPMKQSYMGGLQTLYVSPDIAHHFCEFNSGINTLRPGVSDIGGLYYVAYSIGDNTDGSVDADRNNLFNPRQLWAGRVPLIPVTDNIPLGKIDKRWLMSEAAYNAMPTHHSFQRRFEDLEAWTYSRTIGEAILHEKIHDIQDPYLPLPILEAAAYHYVIDIFKRQNLEPSIGSNNTTQLAAHFGECVEQRGEDVHNYIFGTLQDRQTWADVHRFMKSKFSVDEIQRLSTFNEDEGYGIPNTHQHIHWETIPVPPSDTT